MMFEPFPPFVASAFDVAVAAQSWQLRGAMALRRDVFCREQRLFDDNDRDATDAHATMIVAVASLGVAGDEVIGTVRIHQAEPGLWWGSRLAVAPRYRRAGALGPALIRLAVCTARARGCDTFLAHVQGQNAPLFHRLHWHTLAELVLHGRPHHRMQADLACYPAHGAVDAYVPLERRAA